MTPYYRSPDGAITVFCARWEAVHAAGLVPVREVALVHADPPYGQNERTERAAAGRGLAAGGKRSRLPHGGRGRNFARIEGDDRPFDPRPLLNLQRPLVLWGAHLAAPSPPPSPSWLIWGKRDGQTADDNGDCEMAWTNLGGPIRELQHFWRGALRATEKVESHLHPTQKPIALCSWIFRERAKLKPGALVFVPYGGSMPELAACVAMGLRCIACEVSEDYCAAAVGARLHASPASPLDALPLFAPRSP